MAEISIPVLFGSAFDLSLLDFSFKDIKIYDIQSKEFEEYISSLQPDALEHNFNFFREIIEKIHSAYEKRYAIVKREPRIDYNADDIFNVHKFLLILFPSDLQIESIIVYDVDENFIQTSYMSSYDRRFIDEYPGDLLIVLDNKIPEINEFAQSYFDGLNADNYIGITIENYIMSFYSSHLHYQYLTLCIALESVIYGNYELTYRLRRTIAVLCGGDKFNCQTIYSNLNKIYKLRSRIIHGEDYDMEMVKAYLKPLRAIVSSISFII